MGKLPGWSFMLVGIIFMGYSQFIESKRPTVNLAFFFWIGVLLLIFGFFRELKRFSKSPRHKSAPVGPPLHREPEHASAKHPAHQAQSHHATHQHLRPMQHQSHPYAHTRPCPRCHQRNPLHIQHCGSCGFRFF